MKHFKLSQVHNKYYFIQPHKLTDTGNLISEAVTVLLILILPPRPPTTHNPQPTTHDPRPTTHDPQAAAYCEAQNTKGKQQISKGNIYRLVCPGSLCPLLVSVRASTIYVWYTTYIYVCGVCIYIYICGPKVEFIPYFQILRIQFLILENVTFFNAGGR